MEMMKNIALQSGLLCCLGITLLCAVTGCSPSTADGCLNRAAEAAVNNKWEKALKLARRAVELDENNVNALVFRAIASERCGERDMALDSARRAAELEPSHFAAQYTLGRLYAADPTRAVEAQRALLKALKARPGDENTLILLANCAANVRSAQMMNYLLMLRKFPAVEKSAAWHNQMAIAYFRQKDYPRAKTEFLTACRMDSKAPLAVLNLGTFLEKYGRQRSNAENFYRHFLKLTENDAQYESLRADVAQRLKGR